MLIPPSTKAYKNLASFRSKSEGVSNMSQIIFELSFHHVASVSKHLLVSIQPAC